VNTHSQLDENLRSCIASEKGLLSQSDFEHVMKVIEAYSKVHLFEMRQKSTEKRRDIYSVIAAGEEKCSSLKDACENYLAIIGEQMEKEVKKFNKATIEVLSLADIKPYVFNQTIELFMIKADNTLENLIESTKLSLFSLFTVD